MTLVSLNVGLPREVSWRGQRVTTGIYKSPVSGRVALRTENLDGDRQADLTVHGGPAKAVYCYPSEHYEFWTHQLARDLPFGAFGENFTTEGIDEDSAHIGDEFAIGSARVVVTQPRMPCYKLGIRFESDQMVKRFLASGRSGFYVAVLQEGIVGAGDAIEPVAKHPAAVRVSDISRLYVAKTYTAADRDLVTKALQRRQPARLVERVFAPASLAHNLAHETDVLCLHSGVSRVRDGITAGRRAESGAEGPAGTCGAGRQIRGGERRQGRRLLARNRGREDVL